MGAICAAPRTSTATRRCCGPADRSTHNANSKTDQLRRAQSIEQAGRIPFPRGVSLCSHEHSLLMQTWDAFWDHQAVTFSDTTPRRESVSQGQTTYNHIQPLLVTHLYNMHVTVSVVHNYVLAPITAQHTPPPHTHTHLHVLWFPGTPTHHMG